MIIICDHIKYFRHLIRYGVGAEKLADSTDPSFQWISQYNQVFFSRHKFFRINKFTGGNYATF